MLKAGRTHERKNGRKTRSLIRAMSEAGVTKIATSCTTLGRGFDYHWWHMNVGGGVRLIKPTKLYICAKTHYKHDEDGRTAPGVRGHGSVPQGHS